MMKTVMMVVMMVCLLSAPADARWKGWKRIEKVIAKAASQVSVNANVNI